MIAVVTNDMEDLAATNLRHSAEPGIGYCFTQ
jgi:hypothetical protein